jgi:hypothetical protein
MKEKPIPNLNEPFTQDFLSNRTLAAQIRDAERAFAQNPIYPIDLRSVPKEHWKDYLAFHVVLPPEVSKYLDGRTGPIKDAHEIAMLEDKVAAFHGVTLPYTINIDCTMERFGRAWAYEPDAAKSLTGFYLELLDERGVREFLKEDAKLSGN